MLRLVGNAIFIHKQYHYKPLDGNITPLSKLLTFDPLLNTNKFMEWTLLMVVVCTHNYSGIKNSSSVVLCSQRMTWLVSETCQSAPEQTLNLGLLTQGYAALGHNNQIKVRFSTLGVPPCSTCGRSCPRGLWENQQPPLWLLCICSWILCSTSCIFLSYTERQ